MKRYAAGLSATFKALARHKPDVVFCQNPSILLALLMVQLSLLLRFTVIVDSHNNGVLPREGRSKFLALLAKFVHRFAHITIVHNEALSPVIERNGGRPFVLPDKFPDIPGAAIPLKGYRNLLLITSWAADEPCEEALEAARKIDGAITIYAVGNYKKRRIDPSAVPPNVILTGYIPDDRFFDLLRSVDAVIDLTNRDNCLVCGAYEGVSAGKPLVLSDTPVLRDYFDTGAVFTNNTAEDIARAVREVLEKKESLSKEIAGLRERRDREWELKKTALLSLAGLAEPGTGAHS
jgi:glycosyltransferase involved in cell wall biosynthesis